MIVLVVDLMEWRHLSFGVFSSIEMTVRAPVASAWICKLLSSFWFFPYLYEDKSHPTKAVNSYALRRSGGTRIDKSYLFYKRYLCDAHRG